MIINEIRELTEGFLVVHDAATGERFVRRKATLLHTCNDLRGIAKLNGQFQTPAETGACNICTIQGVPYARLRSFYGGSVRYVGRDHKFRAMYERRMPRAFKPYAYQDRPNLQTNASVRAANEQGFHQWYHFPDPFNIIPHWDTPRMHLNDGAHLTVNMLKMTFGLLLGIGKFKYDMKRHLKERELGRFRELGDEKVVDGKRQVNRLNDPPWLLSKPYQRQVSVWLRNAGHYDGPIIDLVKYFNAMKFAQWLNFAGNAALIVFTF